MKLFVFGALDRRLGVMYLFQHHDVIFDLPSLLLFPANEVERISVVWLAYSIIGGG